MKVKNQVIKSYSATDFTVELDKFLEDKERYSIQYRPVSGASGTTKYTVLVTYEEEDESI